MTTHRSIDPRAPQRLQSGSLGAVDGWWGTGLLGWTGAAASAIALASAVGLADCTSTACTTEAKSALVVTVVDASGERVCDALVTVTDGAFSGALSWVGDGVSCAYAGPQERQGMYSLEVRSGAKGRKLDGLKVTADACHVRPREVTVALDH